MNRGGARESSGGARENSGGARANSGGARENSGGARENSGGIRENSGGARDNSGGARENSGGARENSGGARQNSGDARENSGGKRENTGGARENSGGARRNSGGVRPNSGGRRENSGGSRHNSGGRREGSGRKRRRVIDERNATITPSQTGRILDLSSELLVPPPLPPGFLTSTTTITPRLPPLPPAFPLGSNAPLSMNELLEPPPLPPGFGAPRREEPPNTSVQQPEEMDIDHPGQNDESVITAREPAETRDDHEEEDDDDFMEIQPVREEPSNVVNIVQHNVNEDFIDLVDVQDFQERAEDGGGAQVIEQALDENGVDVLQMRDAAKAHSEIYREVFYVWDPEKEQAKDTGILPEGLIFASSPGRHCTKCGSLTHKRRECREEDWVCMIRHCKKCGTVLLGKEPEGVCCGMASRSGWGVSFQRRHTNAELERAYSLRGFRVNTLALNNLKAMVPSTLKQV